MIMCTRGKSLLVGGFKYFLFSTLPWETTSWLTTSYSAVFVREILATANCHKNGKKSGV